MGCGTSDVIPVFEFYWNFGDGFDCGRGWNELGVGVAHFVIVPMRSVRAANQNLFFADGQYGIHFW